MTTKTKKPTTASEIGRLGYLAMRRKVSKKQYRENCRKGVLAANKEKTKKAKGNRP
jgi:hypothetical protein